VNNVSDDARWQRRMYISANDLRHNSSAGQHSSRSSSSGRENTAGSILKKRPEVNGRLENNSNSGSSSTIVGAELVCGTRQILKYLRFTSVNFFGGYSDNSAVVKILINYIITQNGGGKEVCMKSIHISVFGRTGAPQKGSPICQRMLDRGATCSASVWRDARFKSSLGAARHSLANGLGVVCVVLLSLKFTTF